MHPDEYLYKADSPLVNQNRWKISLGPEAWNPHWTSETKSRKLLMALSDRLRLGFTAGMGSGFSCSGML
jgi:hypothetical protein